VVIPLAAGLAVRGHVVVVLRHASRVVSGFQRLVVSLLPALGEVGLVRNQTAYFFLRAALIVFGIIAWHVARTYWR